MERTFYRQFFGLALALVALTGLGALASVALLVGEVRADEFELPAWSQKLKASDRFKLVMGGAAVLDKETGLVWEKSPGDTNNSGGVTDADKLSWSAAGSHCINKTVGGAKGWRLPSFEELASLVDPNNPGGNPDLPPGHPFLNVQSDDYWSATTPAGSPSSAWSVFFDVGVVSTGIKTADSFFVWCVRGDGPLSEY